jgi:hypothetical protein
VSYALYDLSGLALAALICGPLLLLPAIAIGERLDALGFRQPGGLRGGRLALLIGCATLPVIDSLAARLLGLDAALLIHLALAAMGLCVVVRRGIPPLSFSLRYAPLAVLWLVFLSVAWIDFDWGGELHTSLLMLDATKHAGTVRAMVESGTAPPSDIFVQRDTPAGYYYFYYVLSALVERVAQGLVDSRAAVAGQIYWTGLALLALALTLLENMRRLADQRIAPVVLVLMLATGLEIIGVLFFGLAGGLWFGQVSWWKDSVGGFLHSVLWVPHHVTALIASWTGLLVLSAASPRRLENSCLRLPSVLIAGLAFASALGLSVWVALGAAVSVAVWLVVLLREGRRSEANLILAAGLLSTLLAAPQLHDMLAYRAPGSFPIALAVRSFPFVEANIEQGIVTNLIGLLALPINVMLELGVLAIGTVVYWRRHRRRLTAMTETERVLVISALCGLLLSFFVRSTVANNDLGWRVLLFTQIAALVWTAAVAAPLWRLARRRWRTQPRGLSLPAAAKAMVAALAFGYCGLAYEVFALRAYNVFHMQGLAKEPRDEAVDLEVRRAYDWANGVLPHTAVLQHYPPANLWFGLYGRFPVAVADRNLSPIFGASTVTIAERLDDLKPVWDGDIGALEARRRLDKHRVSAVMVTSRDAAWHLKDAWVWTTPAAFESDRVRVILVDTIEARRAEL